MNNKSCDCNKKTLKNNLEASEELICDINTNNCNKNKNDSKINNKIKNKNN